jgi:hypothetical protein
MSVQQEALEYALELLTDQQIAEGIAALQRGRILHERAIAEGFTAWPLQEERIAAQELVLDTLCEIQWQREETRQCEQYWREASLAECEGEKG